MNRKLALAVASACMMAPAPLYALGLGTITLHSHLDEKLNADIRLYSDNPAELSGALVSLASPAAFARAGIDRPLILSQLHFKLLPKVNGHPVIQVTSDQPVREPFLNFIVEVDWRNGRILRQYTVLLNPPTMTALTPSGVRPAAAPAASLPRTAKAIPLAGAGAPVSGVVAAPMRRGVVQRGTTGRQPAASAPGTIRTARNDTLWAIAQRVRPGKEVTVEQMMLALLDANPQAFYAHNINRLKAGYVLRVPDVSQVLGIDAKGALAQVRHQNLLWERYRQRLARSAGGAHPASTPKAGARSAHGAPSAAEMEEHRLRLLAPSAGTATGAGASGGTAAKTQQALKNQLALANEAAASKAEEAKNLQGRVSALQGQVSKLKELLSLKDQQLAAMQARVKPATPSTVPAAAPAAVKPSAPAAKPAAPAAKAAAPSASKPAAPPATKPAPPPAAPAVQVTAPVKKAGTLRDLFNDRGLLALLGGGVVVVLALVWLVLRRRRSGDDGLPLEMDAADLTPDDGDIASEFAQEAMSAGPDGEEAAEAPETALAEAGGDALAEAEIYMAYGRYEQAAEQLAQAVQSEPERADLKVKLLEAYHALGDRAAFESTAEALYADLGDASHPLWGEVARWGAETCPEHPLFRGEVAPGAEGTEPDVSSADTSSTDASAGEPVDELLRTLAAEAQEGGADQGHPAAEASFPEAEMPEEEALTPPPVEEGAAGVGEPASEGHGGGDEEIDFGFVLPEEAGAETPDAEPAPQESHTPEESPEEAPAPSNVIEWEGGLASVGATHGDEEEMSAAAEEDTALGEPDEIGTKLDLARAYLDMGDQEGARELLAEVLEEGSDPQREEAEGLMQQLSA